MLKSLQLRRNSRPSWPQRSSWRQVLAASAAAVCRAATFSVFEHALLEEAIAAREADQAVFSLALMDLALARDIALHGCRTTGLGHCMQLERFEEACVAWRLMASASG